ncbi:MAG: hypothetical protein UR39_C0002G0007 [Candidatus Woesebacteria bacterium GW2011_GWA1_33_30]|uniref:Uncharacterized protein n=1 Tax=Candidatus Woesebacteria bacterium GW2011_GWA2_33_28 TaxID=1618561 RepID=A0A0F9ZUH5_9BACT|nr:MAG: hypothetical protein UR38_C0002G0007 [Candidatus Woesebacteria bacterium GW2011_GWA2_33_28]KKP48717.1 MAG: hypothetical protein UR39_C0002G0007 [Candidatus Woesebacteria bacterium GW2011_GWA1_33_30]KKP49990.1 MAG: hypothetical protein UR40_C0002G0007 [Microgenomates group bacterium GW2011_GWC1_33_32]KKP51761.1 MAG: hypothetical protein UR44_C0006G0007 [Candidatus Woesebacteria bacterium GW2011_GWB1_33_38]KKP56778.1 MAG: hypothetical protein UR48_C0029G0009 [Microgenomates group bacteriu
MEKRVVILRVSSDEFLAESLAAAEHERAIMMQYEAQIKKITDDYLGVLTYNANRQIAEIRKKMAPHAVRGLRLLGAMGDVILGENS